MIRGWPLALVLGCGARVPVAAAQESPIRAPDRDPPRTSSAEPTRAHALLKALSACPDADASCRPAVCGISFGAGTTLIASVPLPATHSGSTDGGLVPMGPVYEASIDRAGRLRHFGIAPNLVVCPHDDLAALSGYWQTGGQRPQPFARELAPSLALWLRPDGTYAKGIPDWEVELGVWQPSDDGVLLRPVHHIVGSGGSESFVSGDYEFHGSVQECEAEPRLQAALTSFALTACDGEHPLPCRRHAEHELRRVSDGIALDEAFLVAGCR